jgi:hypothetical protein
MNPTISVEPRLNCGAIRLYPIGDLAAPLETLSGNVIITFKNWQALRLMGYQFRCSACGSVCDEHLGAWLAQQERQREKAR